MDKPRPTPTVSRLRDASSRANDSVTRIRSAAGLAATANTVEIWKCTNATAMAHPIHVYGVRMSMLACDGALPPLYERGLRDTFVAQSKETVTVAVETAAVASPTPSMFHCHILEHEDAGMMGQFITV